VQEDKVEMTDAEARARYMLALAARAFSDEQMRVLAAANGEPAFIEAQAAVPAR
jgi:hypothetical protein